MQIHELPTGTPSDDDVLAIDNGVSTRKTPFSAFEAGENTVTFASEDTETPANWIFPDVLETGTLSALLEELSKAVADVRLIHNSYIFPEFMESGREPSYYSAPGNYYCSAALAASQQDAPFGSAAYQMITLAVPISPTVFLSSTTVQIAFRQPDGTSFVGSGIKIRQSQQGTWHDIIDSRMLGGGVAFKTGKIDIADGSSTYKDASIDISDIVPSGKNVYGATVMLSTNILPYVNASGDVKTWIQSITNSAITIRNKTTAWTEYNYYVTVFYK